MVENDWTGIRILGLKKLEKTTLEAVLREEPGTGRQAVCFSGGKGSRGIHLVTPAEGREASQAYWEQFVAQNGHTGRLKPLNWGLGHHDDKKVDWSLLYANLRMQRKAAEKDAKDQKYSTVRSRGVVLTCEKPGGESLVEPCMEVGFATSKRVLLAQRAHYADKGAIVLWASGGFDGADSPYDMQEGYIDSMVSDWDLRVWDKEVGWQY